VHHCIPTHLRLHLLSDDTHTSAILIFSVSLSSLNPPISFKRTVTQDFFSKFFFLIYQNTRLFSLSYDSVQPLSPLLASNGEHLPSSTERRKNKREREGVKPCMHELRCWDRTSAEKAWGLFHYYTPSASLPISPHLGLLFEI
jgi:hypothetical protein